MSLPVWKKCVVVGLFMVGVLGVVTAPSLLAQKPETKPGEKAAPAAKKSVRRLPAYYGDLVDQTQREKIYALQEKFAAQISPLADQIKALQAQRDSEIESVLNAEQKAKLEKAKADAKAKATAKKAALEKTEEKSAAATTAKPATTTTKPADK